MQHSCQEPIDASDTCDSQVQRLELCHTDTVDVTPSSAEDLCQESVIEKNAVIEWPPTAVEADQERLLHMNSVIEFTN